MKSAQSKMLTVQIRLAMMANDFGLRTIWGNYSTASTSPGVVCMPYFNADDPVQYAASLGFGMHEGAHHRYKSQYDKYVESQSTKGGHHRFALNLFDDGRIDRMAMLEYPGLRGDYEAIEQLFILKGIRKEVTEDTPAIMVLQTYLMYYVGSELLNYAALKPFWHQVKDVAAQRFPAGLLTRLEIISEMGVLTADFDDCWTSADLFLEAIKDSLEELQNQSDSGADDQSGADADGQSGADADGQSGADADDQPGADADDQPGANADGQPRANADDQLGTDASGKQKTSGTKNVSSQIKELQQCLDALQDEASGVETSDKGRLLSSLIEADEQYQMATPLRPRLDGFCDRIGKSSQLPKVTAASRPLTQALMELVETETNCAPGLSRRGKRFVTSRFNRFKQGDLRVYRSKARNIGIDSAILVSLDLSGSMILPQTIAKNACLALALAITDIDGAVVGVQSFGGRNLDLLRFGEDPAAVSCRFDEAYADGGTPMREGLSNAFLALLPEAAERKSVIVITDGEPDNDCSDTFNLLRHYGMDVFGIYIGQYANGKKAMDRYFKPGNWIAVVDVIGLKRELFNLAKNTILAS
ncbi:vWA domain-containing protein [Aeromonas sp. Y311-2]|uniref:vWA domain-containing protein n=1 Tax=Aeromonas sp. Y311-2 TaxID=2990507 RepID=UPI0022E67244|nr:hypothetical protein [Aeromonas sp. Y311-2]